MNTILEGNITTSIDNGAHLVQHGKGQDLLSMYLPDWSGLQLAITVLLILIAYDQCSSFISMDRELR